MSMYKRPPRRVRASPPLFGDKPAYGSFLYDIIIPKSTIHFKFNNDQINKFKLGNKNIELGINHKEYSHTTKLSMDNIISLSADFS